MKISGWGRYPVKDVRVYTPTIISDIQEYLKQHEDAHFIARGLGRSYGDSAMGDTVISTRWLDHILAFDRQTGILCCSPGVNLAQLLEVFVPEGWFLPVTPGTKFVTVGGAIASDVHGKNHHVSGCFCDHVASFDVLVGEGAIVHCSRTEHSDLFYATCGGMGLTGIILSVELRLKPVKSAFIEQTTYKADNLAHVLELFEAQAGSTYSVAWIDCISDGRNLGRSLLMTGEHSDHGGLRFKAPSGIGLPFEMPSVLLNRFSVKTFNTLYYHRVHSRQEKRHVYYVPFFYPLDSISEWNRMYGKNGFTQYQFVIPKAAGPEGLGRILKTIVKSGRGSFLAVLKVFGAENDNLLSFPMEGYTLALDFKIEPELFGLLERLDQMVLEYGGRIYLTKDVRMSAAVFRKSYHGTASFQAVRERYGARGKFVSFQSKRLGLD